MRKGSAKCIVFYDWERDFGVNDWLEIALNFFNLLGTNPELCMCGTKSDKSKETSVKDLKIKVENGKANYKVVELFLTVPGYKQLTFGWRVLISINLYQTKTMMFCFDNNIADLNDNILDSFIFEVTEKCGQVYGIVYERELTKGPDLYAYGMSAGLGYSDEDMKEADKIGAWMNERMSSNRHLTGAFRDVYQKNIISEKHINSKVDGQVLSDWILENNVGSLAPISENSYCWCVKEKEFKIVREVLQRNSLLITPF